MTDTPIEKPTMFVVMHRGTCHGPFLEHDARTFSAELGGDFEIVPLHIPRRPEPWMVTVASGEGPGSGQTSSVSSFAA